ncbi:MAG: hypothetical protein WA102_08925 [Candidatus Methanoperedens sp.]
MNADKNQPEKRRKSLTFIIDKFNAINLRLSAFICGLKFNKPRQPNFIKKLKNQSLLFVNQTSVFFFVNLPLINHYIRFYTDAEKEGLYSKKDGVVVG